MSKRTEGGTAYKQILINAKLETGKRGQKTELTGKRRSVLDRRAIEDEEDSKRSFWLS